MDRVVQRMFEKSPDRVVVVANGDPTPPHVRAPLPRRDHAEAIGEMALAMLPEVRRCAAETGLPLEARIGIATGPVVAGVIGRAKFTYDLWGDTVNTASRMESHGFPGTIQVSERTYERLRDRYELRARGTIDIKGKGPTTTYLLVGRRRREPRARRDLRDRTGR
jgi:adenylate cyclase